jgi:DNA polymerase V
MRYGKGAFMSQKTTGFASPAQGYEEEGIDLNRLLIRNPPATIFVRLDSGDLEALGLARGVILIVDRSIVPAANALVMLRHEGQFLCRLLTFKGGKAEFTNGKDRFNPIDDETEIIGTVTAAINTYDIPH